MRVIRGSFFILKITPPAISFCCGEARLERFRIAPHRAKFPHAESPPAQTDAHLAKEYGAAVFKLDEQRRQDQKRREREQRAAGDERDR